MTEKEDIDVNSYEEVLQVLLALEVGEIRNFHFKMPQKSITLKRIK